ncbi:MAG: hypothetical protein IKJ98_08650 [Bacteroidales bacterium]|nr:hypothetical protein [Bacteroidales bacterium]
MAEFLTTKGIISAIDDIIKYAKKEIFIVSPFLKISKTYRERLKTAAQRGVEVSILLGKNKKMDLETFHDLKDWASFYFYEDLHGKCYYNEKEMVITSMNMYEASEKNREFGTRLSKSDPKDNEIYEKCEMECSEIFSLSDPIKNEDQLLLFPENNREKQETHDKVPHSGFCIRCRKPIAYNPSRPLCEDCYETWSYYQNPDYKENYCHKCGEEDIGISYAKPECSDCFHDRNSWDDEEDFYDDNDDFYDDDYDDDFYDDDFYDDYDDYYDDY